MPAITIDATTTDPEMTCGYCVNAYGLLISSHRLVSCAWPSMSSYATGCCSQALVATMKKPDTTAPRATMIADNQCSQGRMRDSPKRNTPRNEDSAKNANTPSMNSVWPTTGPA